MLNLNAWYGQHVAGGIHKATAGKTFVVYNSTGAAAQIIGELFAPDSDGVSRSFSNFADALAQCVAGRGDYIYVDPSFVTLLSAAELLSAETKSVTILPLGKYDEQSFFENRATATLPQTATGGLFTVTGRVRLLSIIGEVTTATGATATNGKLIATPTVGTAVDMCSAATIASLGVGTQLFITGTLATALQTSNGGAMVSQTAPLLIKAGTIGFNTTANNTGSIKWKVEYLPIDAGAKIISA